MIKLTPVPDKTGLASLPRIAKISLLENKMGMGWESVIPANWLFEMFETSVILLGVAGTSIFKAVAFGGSIGAITTEAIRFSEDWAGLAVGPIKEVAIILVEVWGVSVNGTNVVLILA